MIRGSVRLQQQGSGRLWTVLSAGYRRPVAQLPFQSDATLLLLLPTLQQQSRRGVILSHFSSFMRPSSCSFSTLGINKSVVGKKRPETLLEKLKWNRHRPALFVGTLKSRASRVDKPSPSPSALQATSTSTSTSSYPTIADEASCIVSLLSVGDVVRHPDFNLELLSDLLWSLSKLRLSWSDLPMPLRANLSNERSFFLFRFYTSLRELDENSRSSFSILRMTSLGMTQTNKAFPFIKKHF